MTIDHTWVTNNVIFKFKFGWPELHLLAIVRQNDQGVPFSEYTTALLH